MGWWLCQKRETRTSAAAADWAAAAHASQSAPRMEKEKSRRRRPASPPSSQEGQDSQFAVLCSEKQAKVVAMPSQTRIYKHNITETSFVLRADVVLMAGANCIACSVTNALNN